MQLIDIKIDERVLFCRLGNILNKQAIKPKLAVNWNVTLWQIIIITIYPSFKQLYQMVTNDVKT